MGPGPMGLDPWTHGPGPWADGGDLPLGPSKKLAPMSGVRLVSSPVNRHQFFAWAKVQISTICPGPGPMGPWAQAHGPWAHVAASWFIR